MVRAGGRGPGRSVLCDVNTLNMSAASRARHQREVKMATKTESATRTAAEGLVPQID